MSIYVSIRLSRIRIRIGYTERNHVAMKSAKITLFHDSDLFSNAKSLFYLIGKLFKTLKRKLKFTFNR
jgi:hypothetical protein